MNLNLVRKHVITAVIAVVTALLFCSCAQEPSELPESTAGEEIVVTEDPGIPVENMYMTYRYPSELEEVFSVREASETDRHQAAFYADISGQKLELFSVVLGSQAEETGFELGILEDEKLGQIHVTLVMNEQQPEAWSEEDYQRINQLQERINDIITQFYEDPRFVASR